MTASDQSPLARLMLFLVCLAVVGSIVAGVHYYAIDLPLQEHISILQPENAAFIGCEKCRFACTYSPTPIKCLNDCDLVC